MASAAVPGPAVAASAVRTSEPVVIDGRAADPIWRTAPVIAEFTQFSPVEGGPARFRTEAQVAFDDHNFYVFIRAFDSEPAKISCVLARRDVRPPTDQLKIVIDSFHDRRSGFEFAVSPGGVKRDYAIYDDNNEDGSWDGVWDVATQVDSLGWTAEFRIPLSQLRYAPSATHTFGFAIWRDIERFKERVTEMAAEFGSTLVFPCDVASDAEIAALFLELGKTWNALDGLVHAIAFAPREAITGDFLEGLSREAFRIAHDVSSYSFPALAKAALPLMQGRSGALVTLTYLGADRVVPGYNTMGLAKASLEAGVRYLAASLGPKGIRVNAVSAGPIKTLAASGIAGFSKILKYVEENSPLRRNVTTEDVGNVAAFLLSDLAAGVTGEITYVDCGFNTVVGAIPGAGASG